MSLIIDTKDGKANQWPLLSVHEESQSIVKNHKGFTTSLMSFTLYNYRFFNVFVFVVSALANNMIVQTTTPIITELQALYPNYSRRMISMCALIFYILHPPMAFVSNYLLDNKGLKFGITIGAILMIIGTGIRCFVKYDFGYVIIGQVINAIGNCFITNSPSKVAANWFPPRHRPAVTAIATFAVLASGALGIVIPSFFVSKTNNTEDDVYNLMIAEFIILSVIMVFNIIFFRGEPPTPPSFAAQQKKEAFKKSLHSLFSNPNYIILLIFITLLLGTINAFFVTIGLLIAPFGYQSIDASMMGVFCTAFGLLGSIVGAIILKNTGKFKAIMFTGTILGALCLFIELALLSQETAGYKWTGFFFGGLSGFFAYPVFSTTLEFGCEIAFPVGEASIAGYLLAGGQIFGFALGFVMASVIDGKNKSNSYIGSIIFVGLIFLSILPLNFTKQDLRRSKREIPGTLIQQHHAEKDFEEEIKREFAVDNKTSRIVQEEIHRIH